MDDDVLNMPNWGYYEPFKGGNLGLNLMPGMNDRETKPFFPGTLVGGNGAFHPRDSVATNGAFHPRDSVAGNGAFQPRDSVAGNGAFHPRDNVAAVESPAPINYVRDNWMNQRPRFYNMQVTNPNYAGVPETSQAPSFPFIPPADPSRNENEGEIEESAVKKEGGKPKKRKSKSAVTTPKAKKPKKVKDNSNVSAQGVKPPKKTVALEINGVEMDISGLPVPVCSCTGNPQQCYRWGCGGWQSACCTTNVSIYPLPMSVKRRGARIAGRKMSQGAFKKVLEKLVAQGYNFGNPIDLKTHWARHGTNKFVTIR